MSTAESLAYDVELEERDGFLAECPECGHKSVTVTQDFRATLVDPACSAGYCGCRKSAMVSVCCGAPEHPDVENFCSQCRDGTGFERECECTYEWG